MPTNLAKVNPEVLAWARAEGGWLPEQVAKSLQVKPERVMAWEKGERQPTVRQVENLARFLHRPLSIFFQAEPPDLPPLAAEYRRLPGVPVGAESPALRLAMRRMLSRRAVALNLAEELGEALPSFELIAHLRETPSVVGARLRATLMLSLDTQLAWANEWQAWRWWRTAAEDAGVLVFQFTKVELTEARGVSLLHWPLPAVGINSKERVPETKVFTLLHEMVHLMLARGHEEQPALLEQRSSAEWTSVERFAESAASHAFVPEEALRDAVEALRDRHAGWSIDDVRRLARRFRITPAALATRLRESGFMSWKVYRIWRDEWAAFVAALRPRGGGFATPAEKAVSRAGVPYTRLVLEAMAANRITSVDAARYLDLKFHHFDDLRALLGSSRGDPTTADV
jgi:Zn-dependent peptidase ImmA (M78 family)/transcriptional regulator with XRE-family HTH domain